MSTLPENARLPVKVGTLVLAICCLPYLGIPLPAELRSAYQQPTYKVATGSLLAVLILFQWSLVIFRGRSAVSLKRFMVWHYWVGALAPILLVAHALSAGYGYQVILTAVFLGNCMLGLLSPRVAERKAKGWAKLWLPLHIVASISLVALVIIHVVVVTRYH